VSSAESQSPVESLSLEDIMRRRNEILSELKRLRKIQERVGGKKRVEFLRTLWWKFPKFENNLKWVKPKGKDNKMRLRIKGYPPIAEVGYRTPSSIRGLHPSGLEPVVIANPKDLEGLDPKRHIIYIASTLGSRKRSEVLKIAVERGFKVANG